MLLVAAVAAAALGWTPQAWHLPSRHAVLRAPSRAAMKAADPDDAPIVNNPTISDGAICEFRELATSSKHRVLKQFEAT